MLSNCLLHPSHRDRARAVTCHLQTSSWCFSGVDNTAPCFSSRAELSPLVSNDSQGYGASGQAAATGYGTSYGGTEAAGSSSYGTTGTAAATGYGTAAVADQGGYGAYRGGAATQGRQERSYRPY